MALHLDPRTGIYQFRKVVPEPFRPVFGKREFKKSLKTRSLAEARTLMIAPAAEYEQLLANAKQVLAGGWSEHGHTLLHRWLRDTERGERWLVMAAAMLTAYVAVADRHTRPGQTAEAPETPPEWAFQPAPPDPDEAAELLLKHKVRRIRGLMTWKTRLENLARLHSGKFSWVVEQVLLHAGSTHEDGSPLRDAIAAAGQREMIEAVIGRIKQDKPELRPASSVVMIHADAPPANALPSIPGAAGSTIGITVLEALEAWRSYDKGKKRDRKTISNWSLGVRRFTMMYGDLDLGLVTAQMVRDYRDVMLDVPARASKTIKFLPLAEQAAVAIRDGLPTLAPATVNSALSGLRAITEHVIDKIKSITLEDNAAARAKFVPLSDTDNARLPFDEDDLRAIFRRPSIQDSTGISEETLFWFMLLAAYTGCRLEEIATLRPMNVRTEKGILFVAVEPDRANVRSDQEEAEKSVKTGASIRDIPVHTLLLSAGFAELVERRRSEGAAWLFPDLKPNSMGKRGYRVSRLFARYLEELGITDQEKVFHSFRHTVRRNLRGRANEEIIDLICGHSDGKIGRRYGRGADMRPLREVVELIDYDGPDWDEVIAKGRNLGGLPPLREKDRTARQLGLSL